MALMRCESCGARECSDLACSAAARAAITASASTDVCTMNMVQGDGSPATHYHHLPTCKTPQITPADDRLDNFRANAMIVVMLIGLIATQACLYWAHLQYHGK